MARETRDQIIGGVLLALIPIVLALWAWSFALSGRLSAVETKADSAVKAADYYRVIDQRLSRIEGKLGVGESR
jgi:hypothetical protein